MRLALDQNGTQPYPAVADFNYIRLVAPGVNQPPTVSITAPVSGTTFTAPATISISATASDPDGPVSKVEFFGDSSLIGTVTVAPYNITWNNVAAGTHSITAKATDNPGAATTSAAVSITVNSPNPPPLQPPTDSLAVNQIGRLTSMGNGSMRIFNSYDALGRTTQTVHKLDGTNYVTLTRYGYPQNPSTPGPGTAVSFQSLPDFERLDFTYDAGGAQQSIKTTPRNGSQQTVVSSVRRNARGQTTQVVYGNGALSTHSYNDATNLRLNQIKTVVGATTLQDYLYSFDNNGNVTGVTDNVTSTLSATYGYDDKLDQLTSMTPAGQPALPYRYDNLGNLTNKENVTQTYGGAGRGPHALATSNGVTYNYDANGNLIETRNSNNSVATSITWNAENMPIQVVQSGVTIYQKFFLGESLWKKVEPNVTTYYLPSMRVENGLFRKFFGGFAERSPDGALKFYHNDHLGSASLVTNASGNLITRQAYMPYGEDRFVDPSGSFTPKYQFNFKEKESIGFYDYGARLYNPSTGRWLSPDSSAADGLNRYVYVRNNPLRFTDPTGHQSCAECPAQLRTEAERSQWQREERQLAQFRIEFAQYEAGVLTQPPSFPFDALSATSMHTAAQLRWPGPWIGAAPAATKEKLVIGSVAVGVKTGIVSLAVVVDAKGRVFLEAKAGPSVPMPEFHISKVKMRIKSGGELAPGPIGSVDVNIGPMSVPVHLKWDLTNGLQSDPFQANLLPKIAAEGGLRFLLYDPARKPSRGEYDAPDTWGPTWPKQ